MFCNAIILFLILKFNSAEKITCRDEKGNSVDWFYLYKLPMHFSHSHINDDHTGLRYLFISSDSTKDWTLSSTYINETSSFPGQTLSQILNNNIDSVVVAYNDEEPNSTVDFMDGHTKGVLAANKNSGFWLIHSVPKYPNISEYNYPKNGLHFGQSFLCISLDSDQINVVGEQLIFNEPNVYYSKLSDNYREIYPSIEKVLMKSWKIQGPYWNEIELTSVGGTTFKSFAKGRKFLKELYEDWVAPQLNVSLFVETWRLGPGNLPTNCSKSNHIFNVKRIGFKNLGITFNTTSDHSKWGVAQTKSWICVGDINRQAHQLSRGGGTVCQLNKNLAELYRNLVNDFENCPKISTNFLIK